MGIVIFLPLVTCIYLQFQFNKIEKPLNLNSTYVLVIDNSLLVAYTFYSIIFHSVCNCAYPYFFCHCFSRLGHTYYKKSLVFTFSSSRSVKLVIIIPHQIVDLHRFCYLKQQNALDLVNIQNVEMQSLLFISIA